MRRIDLAPPPYPVDKQFESKEPTLPEFKSLDDIIQKSTLTDANPTIQTQKIIKEFNKGIIDSAVTETSFPGRGERIPPDEFWVVHRNQRPELVIDKGSKVALAYTWVGSVTESISRPKLDTAIINTGMGSILLNVPVNHVALATTGTDKTPIIYGVGPHVIHDPTFMIENEKISLVNIMNKDYVPHRNIHILRVPAGKYAKVWVNSVPHLLPHKVDPYVYQGNFRLEGDPASGSHLVDVASPYINHGYVNRLRVPAGKVAKIWRGSEPILLTSRTEAYDFHDPLFRVEPFGYDANRNPILFENAYAPYIQHGTIHKIRVPAGKVAKVWIGSKAMLLESREAAYEYDDALFRLERASDRELFEDATKKLIVHGNIKRVMPDTGEVAICYDGGKLEIIKPSTGLESKIVIKESPTFRVAEFLETNLRTLTFPSDAVKEQRRKENKETPADEINYEVCKLGDGSRVGVKLVVTFEIKKPELAAGKLGNNTEILRHIENVSSVDMQRALQKCNASDFLSFQYTTTQKAVAAERKDFDMLTSANKEEKTKFATILDNVRDALSADLKEYGIELNRLNSEAPKNLNKELERQSEQQSLVSTETSAKLAVMANQRLIAETTAKQMAEVKRIEQEQINAALVAAAQAKQDAAEMEGRATETKANADAKKIIIEANAQADATMARAKAEAAALKLTSTAQADSFNASPLLYNIAIAGVLGKAMQSMNITIGTEKVAELAERMFTLSGLSRNGFFATGTRLPETAPTTIPAEEVKASTAPAARK